MTHLAIAAFLPLLLLGDAAPDPDAGQLLGLGVTEWVLLLTTIGAGCAALLKWIDLRASKREAHELRLAKLAAEAQVEAMIEGVEAGGDPMTKAAINKASRDHQVEGALESNIRRVTGRFSGLVLGALLLALAGCCAVDHERMALTAETTVKILDDTLALPDASLTPDYVRAVLVRDRDGWEAIRSELTAAPVTSETRARIEGSK